jgi:hypothetical protein
MFEGIRQMNMVSQITCHVESRLIAFRYLVRNVVSEFCFG